MFYVEPSDTYQEILGFGGAFTDSATLNIHNLGPKAADNLMQSYFGPEGKFDPASR